MQIHYILPSNPKYHAPIKPPEPVNELYNDKDGRTKRDKYGEYWMFNDPLPDTGWKDTLSSTDKTYVPHEGFGDNEPIRTKANLNELSLEEVKAYEDEQKLRSSGAQNSSPMLSIAKLI